MLFSSFQGLFVSQILLVAGEGQVAKFKLSGEVTVKVHLEEISLAKEQKRELCLVVGLSEGNSRLVPIKVALLLHQSLAKANFNVD